MFLIETSFMYAVPNGRLALGREFGSAPLHTLIGAPLVAKLRGTGVFKMLGALATRGAPIRVCNGADPDSRQKNLRASQCWCFHQHRHPPPSILRPSVWPGRTL